MGAGAGGSTAAGGVVATGGVVLAASALLEQASKNTPQAIQGRAGMDVSLEKRKWDAAARGREIWEISTPRPAREA